MIRLTPAQYRLVIHIQDLQQQYREGGHHVTCKYLYETFYKDEVKNDASIRTPLQELANKGILTKEYFSDRTGRRVSFSVSEEGQQALGRYEVWGDLEPLTDKQFKMLDRIAQMTSDEIPVTCDSLFEVFYREEVETRRAPRFILGKLSERGYVSRRRAGRNIQFAVSEEGRKAMNLYLLSSDSTTSGIPSVKVRSFCERCGIKGKVFYFRKFYLCGDCLNRDEKEDYPGIFESSFARCMEA